MSENKKNKKFDFNKKKKCAINSINEINCFLTNLNNARKFRKIFPK